MKLKIKNNINKTGFSLIELLVAVAIIAILAGVGIPSYSLYQKKARRAECTSYLSNCYKAQMVLFAEKEFYTRLFADINVGNGNFPPVATKVHYYDYGLKANNNTYNAAGQALNYLNHINTDGDSSGGPYNVAYIDATQIPDPAINQFNCVCRGNIDGDATIDRIRIDQDNVETIHENDVDL